MKANFALIVLMVVLFSCRSNTPKNTGGVPDSLATRNVVTVVDTAAGQNTGPGGGTTEQNTATEAVPPKVALTKPTPAAAVAKTVSTGPVVTFVEIGSVTCIPCKQMQPVMKEIEEKYKGQVKVEFHDVRQDKTIGEKYRIRLIPTQVFLDASGKEFFRHEGFYPAAEISKLIDERISKL